MGKGLKSYWTAVAAAELAVLALTSSYAVQAETQIKALNADQQNTIQKNGAVYNIETQEKRNQVGLNKFSQFSLDKENIANFQFGKLDSVVNVVKGSDVTINGMVNAIKDNKVGGNLFFVTDHNIMVGPTGVINAGSLFMGAVSANELKHFETVTSAEKQVNAFLDAKTADARAAFIKGVDASGSVTVSGQIHVQNELALAGKEVTIEKDAQVIRGELFKEIDSSWGTYDKYNNNLVNTDQLKMSSDVATAEDGAIYLVADTMDILGDVYSRGGDIYAAVREKANIDGTLSSRLTESYDTDKKAVNQETAESKGSSGNITIEAVRNKRGTASVELGKNAKVLAFADKNNSTVSGGNIVVKAENVANTVTWDAGSAPVKAEVLIKGAKVEGANVDISAHASNENGSNAAKELAENVRPIVEAGIEKAEASVTIEKGDGDQKANIAAKGNKHIVYGSDGKALEKQPDSGSVSIHADTESKVGGMGLDFAIGIGVAKSTANAAVSISGANISADQDAEIRVQGKNAVELSALDIDSFVGQLPGSINVQYGQIRSSVTADVASDATITAGRNVSIEAEGTREAAVSADASKEGGILNAAVAVTSIKTDVSVSSKGTIEAGGKAQFNALNTIAYETDSDGKKKYLAIDTGAKIYDGKSYLSPITEPISKYAAPAKEKISEGFQKLKRAIKGDSADADTENKESGLEKLQNIGKQYGVSVGAAAEMQENTANVVLGGNITAKGIEAHAETVDRAKLNSDVAITGIKGSEEVSIEYKKAGLTAAVNYGENQNTAHVTILSGAKLHAKNENVSLTSRVFRPYQTGYEGLSATEWLKKLVNVKDSKLGVDKDFFDSWSRTSADAEKFGGALSLDMVHDTNDSKVIVEKGAEINDAKDVEAKAFVDITAVHGSGNISSPLKDIAALKLNKDSFGGMWGSSGKSSAGAAALNTKYTNTARVELVQGAVIDAAGDVKTDAQTKVNNITLAAAGGKGETFALDGTVSVNEIRNRTEVVNHAQITAGRNIEAHSEDITRNVNISGSGTKSGTVGIGASIASNKVTRDTTVEGSGIWSAGGKIDTLAKNSGDIVTVTLAGAMASENTTTHKNTAGQTNSDANDPAETEEDNLTSLFAEYGLDMGESENAAANDLFAEDNLTSLFAEYGLDMGESEVAGNGADSGAGEKKKTGVAVAGTVGLNKVEDTTKVTLGKAGTNSSFTADTVRALSENDSNIYAVSGAASLSTTEGKGSTAIGGDYEGNSVTNRTETKVEQALIQANSGEDAVSLQAKNKGHILNVAVSAGAASKGNGIAGQAAVNKISSITKTTVNNSQIQAKGKVTADSTDQSRIDSYGGGFAYGGGYAGVGASIGVNLVDTETKTAVNDTDIEGIPETTEQGEVVKRSNAGDISITANDAITVRSASAGAAVTTGESGFTGAFSAAGNRIASDTQASFTGSKTHRLYGENIKAEAKDTASATIISGNAAVNTKGASGASAGAAVSVLKNTGTTKAFIDHADIQGTSVSAKSYSALNDGSQDLADTNKQLALKDGDDGTAKTIAVGGSGGSTIGAQGSVTVNHVNRTSEAYIGAGSTVDVSDTVSVQAENRNKIFGLAGALSHGTKGAIGAGVDTENLTTSTKAHIDAGVTVKNAKAVDVAAHSLEQITSIGAGVALGGNGALQAAVNTQSIHTDTEAYIGSDTDTEKNHVVLENVGDVSVKATDDQSTKANAFDIAAAYDLTKSASGGAAVSTDSTKKNVRAAIGKYADIRAQNLDVDAKDDTYHLNTANGAAIGGVGMQGSVAVTSVDKTVEANIGDSAKIVLSRKDGEKDSDGKQTGIANVHADSTYTHVGEAGSVAGGGVSAGAAVNTNTIRSNVSAHTGESTEITAAQRVSVTAANQQKLTEAAAAAAIAGNTAMDGSVARNSIIDSTKAYLGGNNKVTVTKEGGDKAAQNSTYGIFVDSRDDTTISGGAGGLAGSGTAAGGGAVNVNLIQKDTESYVGKGSQLNSRWKTDVKADNTESFTGAAVQGSGAMTAAAAGSVAVTEFDVTTNAHTEEDVKINQDKAYSSAASSELDIQADHTIKKYSSTVISGAAGMTVGIGGAVDVASFHSNTQAYAGANNKINTGGAASIKAVEDRGTIHSNTVAAAAAATVGAAGSVSVYDFSGDGTGAYESYLKGNGKNVVTDAKEKTGASSAQMRNKETSVTAEVGKGTTIQSGSLTIDSKDSLTMNTKAGAGAASANTAVGATVSVVNANTKTAARIGDNAKITTTAGDVGVHADTEHRFGGNIAGASASYYAAGAVVVSKTTDKAATEAAIGSGTTIQSEKDILIDAERTHDNSVTAVGASAAVYGAAAAVELEDEIEGKTEAHLGKEENEIASDIKGGNIKGDNIKIDADTKVKTDLTAVAPTAAGVAGGAGTGVKAIDKTTTRAYIGKKERISEANSVAVHAAAAPELNVTGTAAGIGVAAGVGAVTALASSNETVTAEILDGAKLGSKEKTIGSLDVSARTNVPKDGSTLHVAATGASGGIAGATAVFAEANMNDTTKAIVGKSVEVYAGKDKGTIQVEAVHEEQNVVDIQSIGVAGAGGTGAKSTNTSQSTAAVEIAKGSTKENDASVLYNQQNQVRILAENGTSSGGNQSNTQVVGVSAVGASGLTAKSQKNYAASVDIGANTLIHGSSDPGILQKYADKNAVVIQAVNHVKASDTLQHEIVSGASGAGLVNTNTTKADAAVHVGGSARIESGLTDRLSSTVKADSENQALRKTDKIEETKGYESDTVGGGNIVIAAYNDANIKSQADMSAWALISGAGIKNKVEYTGTQTVDIGKNAAVETAEGSISLLAGRKASGEAQQVRVHGAGILNNHALAPISAGSGPVVSGTSESKINLGEGSGIYSDQDVNIRSNEDNLQVTHNGQLKDWTREMIDMFGGDVVNIGSSKETQSGTIVADGKVATGIHRKQEIEIGGTYDEKTGTWNTLVERDGSVGFDVELGKTASSLLFERMNELETLIADYAGDPAAKKAYEMELEEIQDKLVDQGLGVYGEGNKFYALAQGELSEFDEAHNFLLLNEGKRDDLVKQKEGLTLAKEKVDALKKAYTDWNTETDAVKKDEAFHKMETVLAEYNSSVSQEDTFQIGNMEEAKIIDAKIQRADLAISTRIDAASDCRVTIHMLQKE